MNTLRVLASSRVWVPVLGTTAVLALVFYAYLGAVVSPEENLEDLPIALVNEDRSGELAGKGVNLEDRVVENVTVSAMTHYRINYDENLRTARAKRLSRRRGRKARSCRRKRR